MNINNFGPFNSDVWGTVSDWFIGLITLGTVYFLYKTLKSQIKVQLQQQAITEIELRRYLDAIKPDLNGELINYKDIDGMRSFHVKLTPINNVPEKFEYSFSQEPIGFIDRTGFKFDKVTFQIGHPIHLFFSWKDLHDKNGLVAGLKCFVEDKIGTKHEILFMILNKEGEIRKVGPTLISYPSLMNNIK